jgi:hypothetical protein
MAVAQNHAPEPYTTAASCSPLSLSSDSALAPSRLKGLSIRDKSPTRLKRAHNKVRTGCVTCRRRRVKCDEARPRCKRCAKADRLCEGYRASDGPRMFTKDTQQSILLLKAPARSDLAVCMDSADMLHPFEHYMQQTASHMSLMFVSMLNATVGDQLQALDLAKRSHTLWSCVVPTLCQFEPTLQYAVAALSSLHEWLHVSQQPAWQNPTFARFYSRAVLGVNMTAGSSSRATVTVLLSCLIFAQCEILMSSQSNAANQICSGLDIISDLQASGQPMPLVVQEYIGPIFNAFLTLRNGPSPELEFEQHIHSDPVQRLIAILPNCFTSTAHASEHLHEVIYSTLLLQELGEPVDRRFLMATRKLANNWSILFDSLRHSSTQLRSLEHLLLLSQHRMVQLILKTMPPERDEHHEHAEHDFHIMLSQMQSYLKYNDSSPGGPGSGIITPLFFTATHAPTLNLRLSALDTLAELRTREGHWTSCVAHAIASKAIELAQRPGPAFVTASSKSQRTHQDYGRAHGYECSCEQSEPAENASRQQLKRIKLDKIQRVEKSARMLRLTYHVLPLDKDGDVYAMTEDLEVPACVEGCELDWVSLSARAV